MLPEALAVVAVVVQDSVAVGVVGTTAPEAKVEDVVPGAEGMDTERTAAVVMAVAALGEEVMAEGA